MTKLLPHPSALTLPQQVAQMVVVRATGFLFDHQIRYPQWEPPNEQLYQWIGELGVGGVILVGGGAVELSDRVRSLQQLAPLPLLIGADVEEGVGQRFAGATHFPPPMALGAISQTSPTLACQYARQMGEMTARESVAVGINWIYAPVADINNNPDNPVINVRAFGENPTLVSDLIQAYIQGAKCHPVLTTAKHFPGHGDTVVDSHLELPVLPHSLRRLEEMELVPFRGAIAAGVDSIMTGHLVIPSWDTEKPATLSPVILREKLRHTLGFTGLIVTDALVMGALSRHYGAKEAAVLAVQAGVDVLLMPQDPPGAIAAVCQAVAEGKIAPEQIYASVERIWHAKQQVALPADSPQGWRGMANPDTRACVQSIVRESQITTGFLALPHSGGINLVIVDDALDCSVLAKPAPALTLPQEKGYQFYLVDGHTPPVIPPDWNSPTLLQLFVRGYAFRGSATLNTRAIAWFEHLAKTGNLQALVVYGSPYILEVLRPQLPPGVPYVFTYGQMPDAQAIALKTLGF